MKLSSRLVAVVCLLLISSAAGAAPVAHWTSNEYFQNGYTVTVPEEIDGINESTIIHNQVPPNFEEIRRVVGDALYFNENAHINIAPPSLIQFEAEPYSFSVWLKLDTGEDQVVFRKGTNFFEENSDESALASMYDNIRGGCCANGYSTNKNVRECHEMNGDWAPGATSCAYMGTYCLFGYTASQPKSK